MSQYRIVFEPKGAFWCIEIQRLAGIYWERVKDGNREPIKYETYTQARGYVEKIGLDFAYDDRTGPPPVARMVEPAVYQRRVPA